ncbi:hypothetical protein LCGC14_0407490 [marine sediment metagenome]|uniref:Uncharacterized protein n=1 Tax=marine sediment metagenome TaxID=412755 RepID=A0A0F9TD46_9ZZZZ
MPFFPSQTDDPIAILTLEGRNLLARSIIARSQLTGNEPLRTLVSFRLSGFAMGDGGYKLDNPLQISSISDATTQALATIAITDNRFDTTDNIRINGVDFPVGIVVVATGTASGGGTDAGGPTSGYNDGVVDNLGGGGGTLITTGLSINAHIGQRLRIVSGTLAGLDEEIVSNTQTTIEIGITDFNGALFPVSQPPNPADGTDVGKSWDQSGSDGTVVPDITTTYQILTASPGAGTWVPGDTVEDTAQNLADAINASTNPLIQNVVRASVVNAVVTVAALAAGTAGNENTLVEFDAGGTGINNFDVLPGTGSLGGGASPSLESAAFPAGAPSDVEAFLDIERPNAEAVSLVCRVPQDVGNVGFGEIGIYADITDSVNPLEIGNRILYAVGHFPIVAKNTKSVYVTRVITQY